MDVHLQFAEDGGFIEVPGWSPPEESEVTVSDIVKAIEASWDRPDYGSELPIYNYGTDWYTIARHLLENFDITTKENR